MIKTGIYGADSKSAADLIKVLLHHPDVDVRWLCATGASAGVAAAGFHPCLAGETDLYFISNPPLSSVDVVFLCAPASQNRLLLTTVPDIPPTLKIIDLSGEFRKVESDDLQFVYALPELNRKALVRGATRAAVPSIIADAVAMPLLPLAKNLLLNSAIRSTVVASAAVLPEEKRCSARENIISLEGSTGDTELEIAGLLSQLQSSFNSKISLFAFATGVSSGLLSVSEVTTNIAIEEIKNIYHNFFDDHNFITIADTEPTIDNVRGTNKVIIHLRKTDSRLIVTAAMDDKLKAFVGNAVHAMNLLFGLSEKTGLTL